MYFRDRDRADQLLVTYLVVLPVSVNVSKYMPPMLAPYMSGLTPAELSCFAFPPVPEAMEDNVSLRDLAVARGDDLLYGGTVPSQDMTTVLTQVNEIVQEYAETYNAHLQATETVHAKEPNEPVELGAGVNEVLYGLMGSLEKLNELSRLVGKLRYAVETQDAGMLEEASSDVHTLRQHLPDEYRIERILEVASQASPRAGSLAKLYVDRCYRLLREEYGEFQAVEEEIRALETEQDDPGV